MKAIIMAGGAGSRLRPLTCGRPKPIVPIMNKPVMAHIIELLKKNGITEIGVTLQYLPEKIENMFNSFEDIHSVFVNDGNSDIWHLINLESKNINGSYNINNDRKIRKLNNYFFAAFSGDGKNYIFESINGKPIAEIYENCKNN